MRKISKTIAVMGLMAPMAANALGIGEIKLRSALNQALNAEIPLVTSGSESLSDIKIAIAPPDAFAKAGIERHYALSKLRFSAVQRSDGTSIIKITSSDIIREPFLNFLIEVNWPQGRLLREFTVLLDPPSTFPEETLATPSVPEAPSYSSRESSADSEVAARPRSPSRGSSSSARRPVPEGQYTGTGYGPIRRDETLWSIAKTINEDSDVSQEQMVLALYKANPEAFYRDDPNALKAGASLRIPDRATVLQLAPARAAHQKRSATEGRLTERRPERPAPPPESQGQTPEGQLKLLSPTDGKAGPEGAAPGVKDAQGKSKGDIALEVADTFKQENEDIRSRLAELEQRLTSMQKLLSLKDEQIASLQGQKPLAPATEAPKPTEAALPQGTGAPPEVKPEAVTPTSAPPQISPPPVTSAPAIAETAPPKIPVAPPAAVVPPPRPSAVPPPVKHEVEPPGFIDSLLENPAYLAALGGGTLLIGALAWLAMRRRAAMFDETESILAPSPAEKLPEFAVAPAIRGNEAASPEPVVQAAKSSLLSEFTPSDFDALGSEADEVDPISEADVYLAYGRYKQAEELIQHAIEQYPERDECKLKLLEIYYATENRQSFETYAKELFEQNKDADPGFWEKVLEMGRELCPSNPLFETAGEDGQPREDTGYLAPELFGDIGDAIDLEDEFIAELKRFEDIHQSRAEKRSGERKPAPAGPQEQVAVPKMEASPAQNLGKAPEHDYSSIEFDLSPLPKDSGKQQAAPGKGNPEVEFDNLINFEPARTEAAPPAAEPKSKRGNTLDDILLELGAKTGPEEDAVDIPELSDDTAETAGLGLELSADLEPPTTTPSLELPDSEGITEDELYESLTDMDAQETKLDLAKAYIDMGDASTAREILEDVLKKGSEAQRAQAQTWLSKLASSSAE